MTEMKSPARTHLETASRPHKPANPEKGQSHKRLCLIGLKTRTQNPRDNHNSGNLEKMVKLVLNSNVCDQIIPTTRHHYSSLALPPHLSNSASNHQHDKYS